jgi:hypothetical protein
VNSNTCINKVWMIEEKKIMILWFS